MGGVGGALVSRVAFLFPGQGSQAPGMGRALADAFPVSRAVFDEADAALGLPISQVCFSGSEADLALTENTQPAVLTVSIAALRALEAQGIVPSAAAGHSLGEYAAHVAAGTLSFADAVRTVRLRGRFMQEAVPVGTGAMAAILGMDAFGVERACRGAANAEVVTPANFNGPDQIVIAGHARAVARAVAAARAAGAKRVVELPVSAPFHCALMQPAAARLAEELARVSFSDPSIPVYCNVDGRPTRSGSHARDALIRQVTAAVQWEQLVTAMLDDGYSTFVEIGPGKVLAGLVRRISKDVRVFGVADPEGVEAAARELGQNA